MLSYKILSLLAGVLLLSCGETQQIPRPEKLGEKPLVKTVIGAEAVEQINTLHGLSVAPDGNLIAMYDDSMGDVLYVSRFAQDADAVQSFEEMLKKMVQAEKSPFFHLMALPGYDDNVYITLGMGATHYIWRSGSYLLWLQTKQEFGLDLPADLLKMYPISPAGVQPV